VAIEAIKLVEGGLAALCDEVWLVTCNPAAQRERLIARGTAGPDAGQRVAAQAGIAERLGPSATRVLDTSGGVGETREAVLAAYEAALAAAQ
jgi:dephospho-CoA kinase